MNTNLLVKCCVFLFIALSPIQDFFLQGTPMRSLGASPSLFPLLAIILLTFGQWLVSGDLKVDRVFLLCLMYVVLTTIYGFLFFGLTSHQESLIWKSMASLISLALLLFAVNNIDYRMNRFVREGIYTAFAIVVIGFLFSKENPFGLPPLLDLPWLHYTSLSELRPRGFSSEPSELSISAIVFGLLSTHLARSRTAKGLLFALTLSVLIASGSKGGIITLFLCALILGLIRWHSRWYHFAGAICVLLPLGLLLIVRLIPLLFPEDVIMESGTIPTRFSMILCSLTTVVHHPFGVGLSGFLPSVATYLPDAMSTVQSYFPWPLNFDEVSQYQTSADMVSTKTFFFDQLIRFGIPFALVFFFAVGKILRCLMSRKQMIIAVAILATAIAITTYIPIAGVLTVSIVFGVAVSEVRSGTHPLSCE
jgi:hypothetical protein